MNGRILSILDLRQFFNLPAAKSPTEKDRQTGNQPAAFQVLVETPAMEIVLLVDEVVAMESVPVSQVESHTEIVGEMRPEYIRGILPYQPHKDGFASSILIILNLAALLSDKRLIIEEKII
jgi:chemotaxis signal transduction protein